MMIITDCRYCWLNPYGCEVIWLYNCFEIHNHVGTELRVCRT